MELAKSLVGLIQFGEAERVRDKLKAVDAGPSNSETPNAEIPRPLDALFEEATSRAIATCRLLAQQLSLFLDC